MLTQIRIQRYKSLYDTTVDLEPLTVFIGPNGSGKSNICEALFVLSQLVVLGKRSLGNVISDLPYLGKGQDYNSKFWQGIPKDMRFTLFSAFGDKGKKYYIPLEPNGTLSTLTGGTSEILGQVSVYNFDPIAIAQNGKNDFSFSGNGVADILADMILDHRERFDELEQRFIELVPYISRISIARSNGSHTLRLVDRYSDHRISASDISDGTLRILAFLTALYQVKSSNILCFEEPENGVHPWLLHKMMELLNLVSTEGIGGKPVQVLITTHSPVLLNYVKPEQVRVVELDKEGKTQVHKLPTDSVRFRKAMEAYDHEVGELWFTNVIGGNPT